jgi:DNA-binding PadR family transcriptional regulator
MEYTSDNALLRRMIRYFMNVLIMKYLKRQQPANAYDVIKYLHKEFGVLVSPGTVYSVVYSLERQAFIKGKNNPSNRVYRLTDKGEEFIANIRTTKNQIQLLISKIFSAAQEEVANGTHS